MIGRRTIIVALGAMVFGSVLLAQPATPDQPLRIEPQFIGRLIDRAVSDYEPSFGGFGHAPKFPRETVLELLLAFVVTPQSLSYARAGAAVSDLHYTSWQRTTRSVGPATR